MITAERLREILDYDSETGIFRWRISRKSCSAGVIAGSENAKGYWTIRVDGELLYAHRLAWLYVTGDHPKNQIDHIDMRKSNNAWRNLREATNSQNHANTGLRSNNSSGHKGVSWCASRGKWDARLRFRGRQICLGRFDTAYLAKAAYDEKHRELFGGFSRP